MMRQSFLKPSLHQLRRGRWWWLLRQLGKIGTIKFINPYIPWQIRTGPVMAVLIPTYRCNSDCQACDLRRRGEKKREVDIKRFKEIINDLVDMGSSGLSFTGGEPLLYKGIYELIVYARQKSLVTTLNTNGLLLNQKNIARLVEAEPDNTNISLDAAEKSLYRQLRGVDDFERVVENIRELTQAIKRAKKKMTLTVVTVVSSENFDQLVEIAKLAKDLGADKIGFIPLHNISDKARNLEAINCLDEELRGKNLMEKFKTIGEILSIDNSQEYLKMFPAAFAGEKFPLPCLATQTSLFIDCYSDVFYCWPQVEINQPVGNLKKDSLEEIWIGEKLRPARQALQSCRACFWNCQAELSIFFQKI